MLTLYGKTYMKTARDIPLSPHGIASDSINGTYRVAMNGIYLSDIQGNERAFIRNDGVGPVSISSWRGNCRRLDILTRRDSAWLGVPDSYLAQTSGTQFLADRIYNREVAA